MAIGLLWTVSVAIAVVSMVLLGVLLSIYVRSFRKIPSRFSLGLLIFGALFLVQNLAGIVAYFMMAEEYGTEVAVPMLILNAAELAGFGVLLAISWD